MLDIHIRRPKPSASACSSRRDFAILTVFQLYNREVAVHSIIEREKFKNLRSTQCSLTGKTSENSLYTAY